MVKALFNRLDSSLSLGGGSKLTTDADRKAIQIARFKRLAVLCEEAGQKTDALDFVMAGLKSDPQNEGLKSVERRLSRSTNKESQPMNPTISSHRVLILSRIVRAFCLTSTLAVAGCFNATIRPQYKPSGALTPFPQSGEIALKVTDNIDNTAPLVEQVTPYQKTVRVVINGPIFGTLRVLKSGQNLVSQNGPYILDAAPTTVAHRVFRDALAQKGLSVEDQAGQVLNVQLLRLEFLNESDKWHVKLAANLVLRASVQRGDQALAEVVIVEQEEKKFGAMMTPGEIEAFVSKTFSSAAEHTLADERIVSALNHQRAK